MRKWLAFLFIKKRLLVGVFMAILISLFFTNTTPASAEQSIKLMVNGKEIQCDVPPQLINGRIMVPVRFVAEALGTGVIWDGDTNTVNITDNNYTYTSNKELTAAEWKNQLNDVLNNKLLNILQDDSLSNYGKALKISSIIQDNFLHSPPKSLLFEHYCLIQYLFAKQNMFLALDSAKSEIGNAAGFSQAMAIFNFNQGIADGCFDKLKKYLN